MIATQQRVRTADLHDHQALSSLLFFEPRAHRHLDWRAPLDWLGSPHFWVLEESGRIVAALACPADPVGVAWMRLFVAHGSMAEQQAWDTLWNAAQESLTADGGAIVGAIVTQLWFQKYLLNSGFAHSQSVVLLERSGGPVAPPVLAHGLSLAVMHPDDLAEVAAVDADAFPLLWQYSFDTLQRAYQHKIYASVLSDSNGRLLAYQLSSGDSARVHLARLAVRKEAQGRGLGAALVADLIRFTRAANIFRLTVNTQGDNDASLKLYRRWGFLRTGEELAVFTNKIEGG